MRLNETQLNDFRAFRKFNPVSLGVANQQINDLLDTIDALTRERDEARAGIAAAFREAANTALGFEYKLATLTQFGETTVQENPYADVHRVAERILALTPPAAIRAEKLLVAQAEKKIYSVLEERLRREYDPRLPFVKDFSDWVYSQLAAATATPEEIKEEKPDEQ